MSKLGDKLRQMGIVNTYEVLKTFGGPKDVAVTYYANPPGRLGWADMDKTYVWAVDFATDPHSGHYRDQGRKCFVGNRKRSFGEALAWATAQYGITEWATCPTDRSTKIPRAVLKRATEAVRTAGNPDNAEAK